ncbi:hypothetical protein SDJN02_27034, partial [Cucurbita argyrosperma subsp. argyrosperma]
MACKCDANLTPTLSRTHFIIACQLGRRKQPLFHFDVAPTDEFATTLYYTDVGRHRVFSNRIKSFSPPKGPKPSPPTTVLPPISPASLAPVPVSLMIKDGGSIEPFN